jgi:hypothetical protein
VRGLCTGGAVVREPIGRVGTKRSIANTVCINGLVMMIEAVISV